MDGKERGKLLVQQIYDVYRARTEDRRPNRIRPSELGHPCAKYLWFRYRWADKFERFDGRMLRLFQTGHLAEDRMKGDLIDVGSYVYSHDPEDSRSQISMTHGSHVKGFLDGVAENVPHANHDYVLVEYKTHSAKSFKQLEKEGVAKAKVQHYAQMQVYMHKHNLKEALYFSVNKDTDDLYAEFVEYREDYAKSLLDRADMVAYSPSPPPGVSDRPDYFLCKFCSAADTCYKISRPPRSCRTCEFGKPMEGEPGELPEWQCGKHGLVLDLDDQRRGCDDHRYNKHMIEGEDDGPNHDGINRRRSLFEKPID